MNKEDVNEELEQFELEPVARLISYILPLTAAIFFGLAVGASGADAQDRDAEILRQLQQLKAQNQQLLETQRAYEDQDRAWRRHERVMRHHDRAVDRMRDRQDRFIERHRAGPRLSQ